MLYAGAGAEAASATHFTPMPIPVTSAGGNEDNSRCDRDGGATWRCRADQFCQGCEKGRRVFVRGLPNGHRDSDIDGLHGSSNGERQGELRRCRAASATSHRYTWLLSDPTDGCNGEHVRGSRCWSRGRVPGAERTHQCL